MTKEELARELDEMRLNAYHRARMFVVGTLDPAASGYKSVEDAAASIIRQSAKEIEAKLKAWEKANPL